MQHCERRVRVGLIGAGARIRTVARMLVERAPMVQIAAITDPDPVSIEKSRAELPGAWRTEDSVESMLSDKSIEWVMIGSWNCYHAAHVLSALKAGKHVFCEKPLATNMEDCRAMRAAVEASDRHFVFGLVLRYSPHYQTIRRLLDENVIGALVSFEFNETLTGRHGGYIHGNWRRSTALAGSHVLEKCCHDLDLANWMVGARPLRVASFGGRSIYRPEHANLHQVLANAKGDSPFRQWQDHLSVDPFTNDGDILDNQVVILEYENGVRATFHTNAASALPERRFYLLGTHGTIRADAYEGSVFWSRIGAESLIHQSVSDRSNGHAGGDERMVEHLARTMHQGERPLAGIKEAVQSAAVAFAIDASQRSGKVVEVVLA